ncbi:MAG: kelch repeat-containing protein [Verrucomicrobiota bacterium]
MDISRRLNREGIITTCINNTFFRTLAFAALVFGVAGIPRVQAGSFLACNPMNAARAYHTATLLRDGKVLVAGGMGDRLQTLDSAELYDPATGTWTLTGPMNHPRRLHMATLLADGRVLVTGYSTNVSEIYDPATGKWSDLGDLANLPFPRKTATLLPDGKIFFAGTVSIFSEGTVRLENSGGEIYDPTARTWTPAAAIETVFQSPVATLLRNGHVLLAGANSGGKNFNGLIRFWGYPDATATNKGLPSVAAIYNPSDGKWRSITNTITWLDNGPHTATLLLDGRVLFVGEQDISGHEPGAQIFDPATETWSATGTMANPRVIHTATLLPDGVVLVVGGRPPFGMVEGGRAVRAFGSAEVFLPAGKTWTKLSSQLAFPRVAHTATLLPNGKVLIAGGQGLKPGCLSSAEIYDPETAPVR